MVRLYIDDHDPPHAHVRCEEREAKTALGDEAAAPFVIDVGQLAKHELREAVRLVGRNQVRFIREWKKYNG